MQQCQAIFENFDPNTMSICCVPTICHVDNPILFENLSDSVKVTCNNEGCLEGEYMHKVCFDQWECSVLTFLRSTGRARSWTERQRLQNLWTKKGYDLAYKACGCKCGKGHLRKDLDWSMRTTPLEDPNKKKKHRKKKNNDKPSLSVQQVPNGHIRTSSMSSISSGSPPASSDCPLSPTWSDSIFTRRQDFSSFNTLPPNKINSYHIKIEDEGNQGNDEIRCFILSTLSANKTVGISCILRFNQMIIFDRYPLIDGTFFYFTSSVLKNFHTC